MKKTWEEATIEEIENYCENNKTGLIIKDGKVTGEERTEGQKKSTRAMIGVVTSAKQKYCSISAFIITQWKEICK